MTACPPTPLRVPADTQERTSGNRIALHAYFGPRIATWRTPGSILSVAISAIPDVVQRGTASYLASRRYRLRSVLQLREMTSATTIAFRLRTFVPLEIGRNHHKNSPLRNMPLDRRSFVATAASIAAAAMAGPAAVSATPSPRGDRAGDPLGLRDDFPIVNNRVFPNSAYIAPIPRQVVAAGHACFSKRRRIIPFSSARS